VVPARQLLAICYLRDGRHARPLDDHLENATTQRLRRPAPEVDTMRRTSSITSMALARKKPTTIA
jgi:hypothetical protein